MAGLLEQIVCFVRVVREIVAGILQMNSNRYEIRVFPALLQDRREVLTATSTLGNPNAGRGSDLAIFPCIWTHSCRRLLLNA
jgi:hypothetical protein